SGLNGKSKLSKISLRNGKVLRQLDLAKEYFGEGITVLNGKIFQLTYQTHKCFVYDFKTFDKIGEFEYEGEGWGMTNDGKHLIMDSGNNNLIFRDPETFKIVNTIGVIDNNGPVAQINELEYLDSFIYANIWQTNYIVKIDPVSGQVVAKADLTDLINRYVPSTTPADANGGSWPNGIAYDRINNQFYITGKLWPKIFAVRFF
ncbi:MAG: glutaminyl-peptide cyclotransferase, partial [Bacteroidota bacterium]|nr:glutaminyl-peptide cyclotransferase [Bacteroidota bacterium]